MEADRAAPDLAQMKCVKGGLASDRIDNRDTVDGIWRSLCHFPEMYVTDSVFFGG